MNNLGIYKEALYWYAKAPKRKLCDLLSQMRANRCRFRKEKINEETYTIRNGEVIESCRFQGFNNLKTIYIKNEFKIDDDHYTRFGSFTPYLEQFHVISKRSPFFAIDGVLYLNIEKAKQKTDCYEPNYFLDNCEVPEKLSGNMLVYMPPKYKDSSFVIPDFVEVIGCAAFCGSNLESLTIPDSVKYIGMGGLGEMVHLKELRVPNKPVYVFWDQNYVGHDINICCSETNIELNPEIKDFWQHLLVEYKYDREVLEPIKSELGIINVFVDPFDFEVFKPQYPTSQ
jgi:hypothetical protein